jgi:geranylgeranyl diphosphate synthase type I
MVLLISMEQAVKQLDKIKEKIDKRLDSFFEIKKKEARAVSPFLSEMVKHIHDLCKKGKRLRAAYIYSSYIACGGKNKKMILDFAIFIELIHCYFLIHDDIIDQDNLRHGIPTIHAIYRKAYESRQKGDPLHFGKSMAIMGGDMTGVLGYDILATSLLTDKIKSQILNKINSLVFNTIAGELFGMNLEVRESIKRKDILTVYKYKTAQYTIESPLHIGAIAAGKNDRKTLNVLSSYGIPLGIAYQIHDDILGIFGDEKKLGKPVGSDIREGKHTLLVWKAFAKANKAQKKILKACLGNNKLTKKQLNDFRQVIIDTGALRYAEKEAEKLLAQALKAINKADLLPQGKKFLIGIAEYLIKRTH